MCLKTGAPKKPSYGLCNERHSGISYPPNWAYDAGTTSATDSFYYNTSTDDSTATTSTGSLTIRVTS